MHTTLVVATLASRAVFLFFSFAFEIMPDSKAIKERNLLDGGTEGIRWGEGEGEEDPSSQDRDGIGSARRGAARLRSWRV